MKTCYIANPSFGKSDKEDELSVEQLNKVINVCVSNNYKTIVICGGMYNFTKSQIRDVRYIKNEVEKVSQILPKNMNINYKILSGAQEMFVLKRDLINMNNDLASKREDVKNLGFDRAIYDNTLIKCLYRKQNNLGFNEGEFITYKNHSYDPSIRLNNIIKDYKGNLVLVGGKNRFEEFVYNDSIIIALPSIMNPGTSKLVPDIGYVLVDKNNNCINVNQYVKYLNKKPIIK